MKQLTAENPAMGMKIIQRYINGVQFLKVTPSHLLPLIQKQVVNQTQGSVETSLSKTGWLRIIKTGKPNEQLEKVKTKLKENLKGDDDLLNKEAEFMRKAGFIVKIEEI